MGQADAYSWQLRGMSSISDSNIFTICDVRHRFPTHYDWYRMGTTFNTAVAYLEAVERENGWSGMFGRALYSLKREMVPNRICRRRELIPATSDTRKFQRYWRAPATNRLSCGCRSICGETLRWDRNMETTP